jgi:ssDNA-binding Zn-finger/Zn-ribbon topoisomerase 1
MARSTSKAASKPAAKSASKSAGKSAPKPAGKSHGRSDYSKAPPLVQSCPQCGADMKIARREPAPGAPHMERLFLECPKCGNTGGKMQAKAQR